MWVQFVTKPVVGAAIGWFTNYLAIRMLFRPQRARRVLGVTVQGVIPKRRQEIAVRVAEAVERELFSHRDIREAISDPGYHVALRSQVQDHLRDYLADKLERTPRLVTNGI